MERLLLIDDEVHILAAMAEYFNARGYTTDCAADEITARYFIDRREYRVVMTDLRLSRSGRFEGLEIIEWVRNRQPNAACIVLTAYGHADNEERARQCGACVFLQKPKPLEEVAAIVATLLHGSGATMPAA